MRRHLTIPLILLCCFLMAAVNGQDRQVQVSGTVIDDTGQGLPGVTVMAGTPPRGLVATDGEGKFTVYVQAGETLTFRFVGFEDRQVKLKPGQTELSVRMQQDEGEIGEVVVRGYAKRSKELSTGSSFSIPGRELQDNPVSNVEQLLQGRVPGLNIQINTGAPGFRGSTQIRGLSTLSVSGSGSESFLQPTSPLYVIDGVPMDADKASEFGFQQQGPGISPLSMIPQEDIASIEVLKDAQATAMYGSRAAYGVIIITTKRGNSKIPRVRYTGNAFMKTPPKLRETLGGNLERQLKIQQILGNALTEEDIWRISSTPFLSDSLNAYFNNSTNWQGIFYQTTYNQSHNLAIDGGDPTFNYKANLGVYTETGVIKNTGFDRYNLNMNMEFRPNEKLRFYGAVFGSIGKQRKGDGAGLLQTGVAENGQSSTLLPGPSFFQTTAGVASALGTDNDNSSRNIRTNLDVSYMLIEGLRISSNISYDFTSNIEDTFTPAAANSQFAQVYAFNGQDYTLYNRNAITYSRTFNEDHNIFINAFNEIYKIGAQNSISRQERTPNDQFQGPWGFDAFLSRGGGVLTNFKDARQAAFAASFSYNYRKKYVIDLSYNLNGSSGTGIDDPYAKAPAVGLRWNFNRENIFENSSWLNAGALRLSWGKNVVPVSNLESIYGKYNITGSYNNQQGIGIDFDLIPNPTLKPTTSEQYNLGLDLSLFDNRVDLMYDAYYKRVENFAIERFLSNTVGFNKVRSNDAGIVNYGHELYVAVRPLSPTAQVGLTISANAAINRDVLIQLPDEYNRQYIRWDDSEYQQHSVFRVGKNTLSNYLRINQGVYSTDTDVPVDPATGLPYQTNGQYFQGGDPIFKDVNGDYILDGNDYEISGNSQPRITGGLTVDVTYKNFGVNVMASFTADRTILNNALADRLSLMRNPFGAGDDNNVVVPLDDIDVWRQPGDVAKYPYAYDYERYGQVSPFRADQTLWAEDGSYLKINNITLYYRFDRRIARMIGLNSLRVYFSAMNLHTFSGYSGPNPENVTSMGRDASGGYPVPRTYNIGVNVEF